MKEESNIKFKDLETVASILEETGADYFLEYGTALGIYRDGDLIKDDLDLDFGVFGNELLEEIKEKLQKEGFYIKYSTGYLSIKRNTLVDIHFYVENNKCFQCWMNNKKPYLFFPKRFRKKIPLIYEGKQYYILSPVEEYLEWVYGDWKTKSNIKANTNWKTKSL